MAHRRTIILNPNLSFHLELKNNTMEYATCNKCGFHLASFSRIYQNGSKLRQLIYLLHSVAEHRCEQRRVTKYRIVKGDLITFDKPIQPLHHIPSTWKQIADKYGGSN